MRIGQLEYEFKHTESEEDIMQNARNDYMVQYLNMSRPNELASATPTRYDQFVAGWRLQGRAGEGSRGTVVAAIDTSNCLVAIKIINRRHSSEVDRISRQITTYQDMTRCLDGHHNVDYIQTLWDVLYENPTPGLRDQVFLVLTPLVEIDFYKLFCQWRADPISMRTAKEFASHQNGGTIGYLAPEREGPRDTCYGTPVDMWTASCIGVELFFLGHRLQKRLDFNPYRDHATFGAQNPPDIEEVQREKQHYDNWMQYLSSYREQTHQHLLKQMLNLCPNDRVTAAKAPAASRNCAPSSFSNNYY
ncbi:hypothetical protein KC361_g7959 [Hortaea werneckii]|nr:hypothetical protein KC361_g7959 [Hortaea werneckii]